MFPWFECFPPELQENILSLLPSECLLNASKVCKLWLEMATRIAESRTRRVMPPECVREMSLAMSGDEDVWLRVLNCHFFQQLILENKLGFTELCTITLESVQIIVCYAQYGSHLFVSHPSTNQPGIIQIYDAEVGDEPTLIFNCQDGPIRKMQIASLLGKLIVLTNTLEIYSLPRFKDEIHEMKRLKVKGLENQLEGLVDFGFFSVDGSSIAVQTSHHAISVFRMRVEIDEEIELRFVNSFESAEMIYKFSIWKDEVLVLLHSGQIRQWVVASDKCSEHGQCQEIRYLNPAWLFRGRVFCSTLRSRVLLGLWHLEAGTSYWLIGKPATSLVRYYNVDPLINGAIDEVTCICLRLNLLFCGTKGGKVVVYHLSNSFFNESEESTDREKVHAEFDREPNLIIPVCDRSIKYVSAEFSDRKIYIMTRFYPPNCFLPPDKKHKGL